MKNWTPQKWMPSLVREENLLGSKRLQLFGSLVLLLALAGASTAFGQSIGTILGVVKDASGASVPGATITITNADTTATRTVTTGDDGAYRVPGLPAGRYGVKVEKSGFKIETQPGLVLDVAQDLVVNAKLQVGTTEQEVVVTGEAPVVNTTNGNLGGLVNEQSMAELPLNGRNYIDLTMLQAGVTQNLATGGQSGAGLEFSSNGAPVWSNNFTLDGAMMVNQYGTSTASEAGTTLGLDGIREFKLITNAFDASYGMTMGSQMLMVSKGGSNRWSGDAFEYLRNSHMDARNFFDYGYQQPGAPRLPLFQRNNFGAAFGGPIKKDKTFFWLVYEGLRQNLGVTINDTVMPAACHQFNNPNTSNTTLVNPSACDTTGVLTPSTVIPQVMQPLIALFPSPNVGNNKFTFPTNSTNRVDFSQLRVDQNFSAADAFFTRYTFDDSFLNNATPTVTISSSGVSFPQFRTLGRSRNQFLTLSENHIFSPTLLNTLRGSFSRTNFAAFNHYLVPLTGPQYSFMPGQAVGGISITSLNLGLAGTGTSFGPNSSLPTLHVQNIYTASDDVFYTKGRHAVKFGVLFNRFNQGLSPSKGLVGSMSFTSVPTFMQGIYQSYTGLTAGSTPNRYFVYNTLGFYIQDDIRLNSRLTANAGLRYEFNTDVTETNGRGSAFRNNTDAAPTLGLIFDNPSYKNVSPRLGLAWDVFGTGKTAIRSGFGLYYDVTSGYGAVMEQEAVGGLPFTRVSTVGSNPTNAVITLPFTFTGGTLNNTWQGPAYHIQSPHVLQYNLTVEQALPGGFGLSVSYVGLRGLNLWKIMEGNPRIPTSITNGVEYWATASNPRINPAYGSFIMGFTAAASNYNSLQVALNKHLGHGVQLQSSYVYSKSLDDVQGSGNLSECSNTGGSNPMDTRFSSILDKGPSCFDLTHSWNTNVIYYIPNIKSDNFAAKLLQGWWVGAIVTVHSGYPFTPGVSTIRSQSNGSGGGTSATDRPNLVSTPGSNTFACTGTGSAWPGAPACNGSTVTYNWIPYDNSKVITHNPAAWFNPLMFNLGPVGYLGNAARDMLRGPGLGTLNMSFNKDTMLPLLGENGKVEFRAEFFNILNRANFAFPSGVVYTGAVSHTTPFSETPIASVGAITSTTTTSRQVQLALKILF